jgi:hypothetical protein
MSNDSQVEEQGHDLEMGQDQNFECIAFCLDTLFFKFQVRRSNVKRFSSKVKKQKGPNVVLYLTLIEKMG